MQQIAIYSSIRFLVVVSHSNGPPTPHKTRLKANFEFITRPETCIMLRFYQKGGSTANDNLTHGRRSASYIVTPFCSDGVSAGTYTASCNSRVHRCSINGILPSNMSLL
eukprot:TRINITY_DN8372_c0_g1_i4.p1 TRINITY_DN8372_c0_g1~~TRINITY_DN8372_c0_g1_i4.p1  ORF type:complete len:109 (-),score=11.14 TRINITY_DN8372_c0_g1_i4:314-640(-)